MARKRLTIASLFANLAGTLLLFWGLQVASLGNFRLAAQPDGSTAVCNGPSAMFSLSANGFHGMTLGEHYSPVCMEHGSAPIAVVVGEHPRYIRAGLALVILGTLLALIAEAHEPIRELRRNRAER